MNIGMLFGTASLTAAMALGAVPPAAQPAQACAAVQPVSPSGNRMLRQEANRLFAAIDADAQATRDAAAKVQSYDNDTLISWETHAVQWNKAQRAVNDIGEKVCRLEEIRPALEPWQQRIVDHVAVSTRLMADNAEDAILFLNDHEGNLWMPMYKRYAANLYQQADQMTKSTSRASDYARVRREYRQLQNDLSPTGGGE